MYDSSISRDFAIKDDLRKGRILHNDERVLDRLGTSHVCDDWTRNCCMSMQEEQEDSIRELQEISAMADKHPPSRTMAGKTKRRLEDNSKAMPSYLV